jgi:NAD+ synthase
VTNPFSAAALDIDPAAACTEIQAAIRHHVLHTLHRRGVVLGVSGGIDSSVVVSLCARALGADRVFALCMPERDSDPESLELAQMMVETLGVASKTESITPMLIAAGCYRRRDEAIRTVIPQYRNGWKSKLVIGGGGIYSFFTLIAESPEGVRESARLSLPAYLGVVAATSFKQRVRKMVEYYHADRLNYAVAGTPNRLEYDLGFFVKCGDGAADLKPIAHLYKQQVYQLAEFLGVPAEIRRRPPTTDTYSLPQSQEEFFFSLPLVNMDLCLFARDHGIPATEVASAVGLNLEEIERIYAHIDAKRRAAAYLHQPPLLVTPMSVSAANSHVGGQRNGDSDRVSRFSRWAALSDHWAAAALRRTRHGFLRFSVPVPHVFARVLLACFLGCRTVIKFFIRVFICEPAFKAYCSSYGRRLTTATHLPWVQGRGRIVVGDDVRINGRIAITFAVRYSDTPVLDVGDGSSIGHNASFVVGKRISIGKDCLIANDVIVFDAPGHPTCAPLRRVGAAAPPAAVKPVTISDNVWIGQRGIICPGVTVGEGAVVSAGSVVMTDVAPYTIVAGNPARRISYADLSKSPSIAPPATILSVEPTGRVRAVGNEPDARLA